MDNALPWRVNQHYSFMALAPLVYLITILGLKLPKAELILFRQQV